MSVPTVLPPIVGGATEASPDNGEGEVNVASSTAIDEEEDEDLDEARVGDGADVAFEDEYADEDEDEGGEDAEDEMGDEEYKNRDLIDVVATDDQLERETDVRQLH